MSGSEEWYWSNNPNAPKISYYVYVSEKSRIAGVSLSAIVYGMYQIFPYTSRYSRLIRSVLVGILVVLFFQCMVALLSSANRRREGIKWWLVVYTALMFSCATILVGTGHAVQFDSYIDNREYPGVEGQRIPGPLGYRAALGPGALLTTDALMFQLNYWLADGFLVSSSFDPKLTRSGV